VISCLLHDSNVLVFQPPLDELPCLFERSGLANRPGLVVMRRNAFTTTQQSPTGRVPWSPPGPTGPVWHVLEGTFDLMLVNGARTFAKVGDPREPGRSSAQTFWG
jgi:hypothetical protein